MVQGLNPESLNLVFKQSETEPPTTVGCWALNTTRAGQLAPSKQKQHSGLWVQRIVAVRGGNMAERNKRWGCCVLHCGIDIRNVPLEVWELWDC